MSLSDLTRKRAKIVVSGASASGQAPSIPSANSATVTSTPSVTGNAAAIHISQDPHLVKEAHIQKEQIVPLMVYQRRRLRGNKKLKAAAATIRDPALSVEEAADRHVQVQQEKIDILTAEKALITQDLKGELEAVSHELEQHKKILEKERARISQFEVEKKKIAVLADVTATYNLLLSFVAAFPDLDYTLLGDDIAQKVEEIRLKLAKEEEKSAIIAGAEG